MKYLWNYLSINRKLNFKYLITNLNIIDYLPPLKSYILVLIAELDGSDSVPHYRQLLAFSSRVNTPIIERQGGCDWRYGKTSASGRVRHRVGFGIG